jgi:sporulation protein YlmC with PRC-barrel domain
MKRQSLLASALLASLAFPAMAQDQQPAPQQVQQPGAASPGAIVQGQGTVQVRPAEPQVRIESQPPEITVETTGEPQIRVVQVPTIAGRMPQDVVGWTVRDSAGEEVGEVRDFVTEQDTAAIQSLVVSRSRLLGLGEKLVTVPWDRVKVGPQGNELVVSLNKDEMDDAPDFEYGAEAKTVIGPEENQK